RSDGNRALAIAPEATEVWTSLAVLKERFSNGFTGLPGGAEPKCDGGPAAGVATGDAEGDIGIAAEQRDAGAGARVLPLAEQGGQIAREHGEIGRRSRPVREPGAQELAAFVEFERGAGGGIADGFTGR